MSSTRTARLVREELSALYTVRQLLNDVPSSHLVVPALLPVLDRIERRLRHAHEATYNDLSPKVVPPNTVQRREPVDPGIAAFAAMLKACNKP